MLRRVSPVRRTEEKLGIAKRNWYDQVASFPACESVQGFPDVAFSLSLHLTWCLRTRHAEHSHDLTAFVIHGPW